MGAASSVMDLLSAHPEDQREAISTRFKEIVDRGKTEEEAVTILQSEFGEINSQDIPPADQSGEKEVEEIASEVKVEKKLNAVQLLPTPKDQVTERKKLWKVIDENGNGYMTLEEATFKMGNHLKDTPDIQPVIASAFKAARSIRSVSKNPLCRTDHAHKYVEWKEFWFFLTALQQRFEYWQAFKQLDTTQDGDLSLEEFCAAKSTIEKWVGPIEDIQAEFKKIDAAGAKKSKDDGHLSFDEFCKWSMAKHLHLDHEEDESHD